MALFFDREWFDARLAAAGLTRTALAARLNLSGEEIGEIWKDQRELQAREVALIAELLGSDPAEIARRAGVSTPVPHAPPGDAAETAQAIADIAARLDRLERMLAETKALLLDLLRERR